jgi:cytosine/adenosine deaminase-related metal-dependent hydrolase
MADYDIRIEDAYLADRDAVRDIGVRDGRIAVIAPTIDGTGAREFDADGSLVFPGFVDAHVHLDQALSAMGDRAPRYNDEPFDKGRNIARTVEYFERTDRETIAAEAIEAGRMAAANGVVALRAHTYVDESIGTKAVEAVTEARAALADLVDVEIVVFPQRGIMYSPALREIAREAIDTGADVLGGIDPASVNADIERTIDAWFDIASALDVDLDVHLHDGGSLGQYTLDRLAERTVEADYESRVTASHAFALADVAVEAGDPRRRGTGYESTLDALEAAGIRIATCYPSTPPGMPVAELQDRTIPVGHGSDELRDLWVAHGNANPIEAGLVQSLKLDRSYGYASNPGLARVWQLLTDGAAAVMDVDEYGIEVGSPANLALVDADSPQWAIIDQQTPRVVIKDGRVTVEGGERAG